MLNELELTGQSRAHVEQNDDLRCALHREALEAFLGLREAARVAGFDLLPLSSFRDIQSQLRIWNGKFRGERSVLAMDGKHLCREDYSDDEYIDAILQWSALPGASRHHWGTDVDIYDASMVRHRRDVQLIPAEFEPGGIFRDLHEWLNAEMGRFGFFRPYHRYRGGIRPEPWHLSFEPISSAALRSLTLYMVENAIKALAMDGKDLILARLSDLFARYVANVDGQAAEVHVRICDPADKDVELLLDELSSDLAAKTGRDGKDFFSIADVSGPRSAFVGAFVDGTPVGCGAIRPLEGDICEIKRMYSRNKGRGVGSCILRELERLARQFGYAAIWLETGVENQAAVRFYVQNGFRVRENFGKYLGRPECICFEKTV